MDFVIVNPDDIPDDLPPGKYTTEIVSATWEKIEVRYIGGEYNSTNPTCLLPIEKE